MQNLHSSVLLGVQDLYIFTNLPTGKKLIIWKTDEHIKLLPLLAFFSPSLTGSTPCESEYLGLLQMLLVHSFEAGNTRASYIRFW